MDAESPKGWRDWLRHAFATEPEGAVEPDPKVRTTLEDLLQRIVKRRMTVPAVVMLESWRPMGRVTGQMMHALTPFTGVVFDPHAWTDLARWLERRGSIPWMIERLESIDAQASSDTGASDA